jgi:hypothetical protein
VRSLGPQRKSHEDLLACVREMRRLHNDRDGIEGESSDTSKENMEQLEGKRDSRELVIMYAIMHASNGMALLIHHF